MTDTTAAALVESDSRLFDLAFPSTADGVTMEVRNSAALHLRNIDSEHASVLGTKVSEWPDRDLGDELRKALDIDPYLLLLKAWSQLIKVREALDKSKTKDEAQNVALAKHEIDVQVEPSIVISAFGVDCRTVKLGLTLAASLESAQLVFVRGALTEVRMGEPTGTLSLSVEGQPIKSGERQLKFHPSIKFKTPLRLAQPSPLAPA